MKLNRMIRAAAAALLLAGASCPAQAAQVSDFKDVPTTAWYFNAVEYAAREGLFAGTSANTFSPDMGMTRGMFVTVLGRKAGVNDAKPNSTSFTDVQTGDYYAPYVEWAKENGIVSGTSASTFSPDQQITREQMATLLYRYIGMNDHYICTESRYNGTGFADYEQVSPYAKDAMSWAVSRKIINGSGGLLDPQGTATRAQVAQVFFNLKEMLVAEDPVTKPTSFESSSLQELKHLVAQRLPEFCQWDERALSCGWYGPMTLRMNGSLENIADGCIYLLTELDGITYDVWYLTELEPGSYVCYYG